MMEAGKTLDQAREFAADLSRKNPGQYVTLSACFGIFATLSKRLHVHSPTDSVGDSYWLNGQERKYTDGQKGADYRATPDLF
ncbi:hypothetical protein LCGC14_1171040 [marine sediment metagenome]|uniref:Uncharacterized protein n=1 Tax=marine sediment metagenome TaxID=412755 RepID=A0A0F9P7Z6_9ZZZZ